MPAVPREVRAEWSRLAAGVHGQPDRFDPRQVARLPEPARRRLLRAIAPGAALAGSVELTMRGQIRLGAWRPFTAHQILTPDGFIWAATARVAGLPVTGFDRYSAGTGQMRWRLLGLLPVVTGSGPDLTRSAAGRLAAEATTLLPTAYDRITWTPGSDPDTAVATWRIGGEEETVQLRVGADGGLHEVLMQRWGDPDGQPHGRYPFGVAVEAERTVGGVTLPSALRAGWWWGTERQDAGEFFRAEITDAAFR
ncbi:hypothetical protein SAMN05660464_1538 [Geodermatophilus dictyosporus]|uniref:Uncharacterized protein n=1 Tax=Geodermatophilus dictyosporus TaxID=1523247 RepID=A0A1I5L443_9ACTN|nr:DUF6544 family protein [Geodermatophilus dictyosporus]SFO91932.1 hypothetical protein SAMN05660464_1538 [Geodermatophilus dictyosporus]